MQLKPYFRYARYDNHANDVSAELNAAFNDVTMEFIRNIYAGNSAAALGNLINRRIETDRSKGHSLNTGGNLMQTFNIPRTGDLLTIEVYGSYDNRHDERFNHFDINFGADPVPADVANRYYKNYPGRLPGRPASRPGAFRSAPGWSGNPPGSGWGGTRR